MVFPSCSPKKKIIIRIKKKKKNQRERIFFYLLEEEPQCHGEHRNQINESGAGSGRGTLLGRGARARGDHRGLLRYYFFFLTYFNFIK